MLIRISRLIRSTAALTLAGRGVQYLSQFVMILVIPRVLAPDAFVQLNLLLPLAALGVAVLFNWLTGALHRYVFEVLGPERPEARRTIVAYYAVALLTLIALYVCLSVVTGSIYRLIPLLLAASALRELLLGLLNNGGRARGYLLANAGFAASLGIFVLLCLHQEALARALALYSFMDITVALVAAVSLGAVSGGRGFEPGILLRYFRYGLPLVANTAAIWIMSVSDRYLLALWQPKEVVASYILSYQLGGSIITVPMSFAVAVVLPRILRLDKDRGEAEALAYCDRLLKLYRRYMIAIFALACAAVLPLKYYVYPAYAFDPVTMVIIVFAHVIYSLIHFYNKEFELNGRTLVITQAVAWGAIVNLIFNLVLIPWFGAIGAAIGTWLAYAATVRRISKAGRYRIGAVGLGAVNE